MNTINHLARPAALTNTANSAKHCKVLYDHQLLTRANVISIFFLAAEGYVEVDEMVMDLTGWMDVLFSGFSLALFYNLRI